MRSTSIMNSFAYLPILMAAQAFFVSTTISSCGKKRVGTEFDGMEYIVTSSSEPIDFTINSGTLSGTRIRIAPGVVPEGAKILVSPAATLAVPEGVTTVSPATMITFKSADGASLVPIQESSIQIDTPLSLPSDMTDEAFSTSISGAYETPIFNNCDTNQVALRPLLNTNFSSRLKSFQAKAVLRSEVIKENTVGLFGLPALANDKLNQVPSKLSFVVPTPGTFQATVAPLERQLERSFMTITSNQVNDITQNIKNVMGSGKLFIKNSLRLGQDEELSVGIELDEVLCEITEDAPTIGTNIVASNIDIDRLTLSWGAASDQYTAAANLEYRVVKASTSTAIDTIEKVDSISGANEVMDWTANITTVDALNLASGTTYFFAVVVRNEAELKALYGPISATTSTDPSDPNFDPTLRDVVAIGNRHSCFVLSSGVMKCVGQNDFGQIGDGTKTTRSAPVQVLTNVVKASAGNRHTCAILQDETIKCWGQNLYGQLGTGDTAEQTSPVTVAGLSGVKQIAAAERHTCALTGNGNVYCWGAGTNGQIGDGSNTQRETPTLVSTLSSVTSIDSQRDHTCAVLSDKTARCWGHNGSGRLGDGTTDNRNIPVNPGLTAVLSVSAGNQHSCAVLAGGVARCWGAGSFGQLGNGLTTVSSATSPIEVTEVSSNISFVMARGERSCFALSSGGVRCMGFGGQGQLGDGSGANSAAAVVVSGISEVVSSMKANQDHSCMQTSVGEFKCWGFNNNYQVGDGTQNQANAPVEVIGL
jgi:alpha-tubulin suppressor-like RCC1 family protein